MRLSYLFLLFQEMVQSLFLKRAKIQLSREQKGKAVARATESSPARVVESNSPSDFETINREAMMDTTNMDTPQRVLVAESARLIVREMVEVERVRSRVPNNCLANPTSKFAESATLLTSELGGLT
ncbi:unnamed protein product, partial [Brassica oleracea var. botrytis]